MWINLLTQGLIDGAGAVGAALGSSSSGGYWYEGPTPKRRKEYGLERRDIRKAVREIATKIVEKADKEEPQQYFVDNSAEFQKMLINELRGYVIPDINAAITRQIQIALAMRERDEEDVILLLM